MTEHPTRRVTDFCESGSMSCPVEGQISMLTKGVQDVFEELRSITKSQTELLVASERREAQNAAMAKEIKALSVKEDDRHKDHERRLLVVEQNSIFFAAVQRLATVVSWGINAVILAVVLLSITWVVKKVSGVDLAPWLHLGGTP